MKNVTLSVLGLPRFSQMPTGVETPHEKVQAPFWLVQTRPRPSPPKRRAMSWAQAQRQSRTGGQVSGRADPWLGLLPTSARGRQSCAHV